MGVDIKIPIGLMFSILGIILTVYGIISNGAPIYQHSFNININLWSGIFMLVFGGIMLLLAFLSKTKKES